MSHEANLEMLPSNLKKPTGSFYLGWIGLTSLGVPVAFLLSAIVLKIITGIVGDFIFVNGVRHITEDYLFMYVFVPIVSLLTGAIQYALFSPYLHRMGWWVFATAAGWALGIVLIALLTELGWIDMARTSLDLVLLLMGLAIGVAQWVVLRGRLSRSSWWIAATVVGWGVLGLLTPGNSLDQYGLLGLGFVPACATAGMLALQMRWSSLHEQKL